jgi:hypothetical protein
MLNRCAADVPPGLALTKVEIHLLDQLVKDKPGDVLQKKTLSTYLTKVARLGGYLARAHDPPPGNQVITERHVPPDGHGIGVHGRCENLWVIVS